MTKTNSEKSTGISFAERFSIIWKLSLMQSPKSKKSKGRVSDCNKSLEGKYANYFKVGYNAFEFVIDFGQNYSENEKAELYTRIVTNPCYAKYLLETIRKSVDQYEIKFGKIHNEWKIKS